MNREIKFRGQRVDNKNWAYGFLIIENSGDYYIHFTCEGVMAACKIIPETVGQLMCKVKREDDTIYEIFEDDLIVHGERVLKVLFINGNASLVNKENKRVILLSFNDGKKIIGNIHDNPQLITT